MSPAGVLALILAALVIHETAGARGSLVVAIVLLAATSAAHALARWRLRQHAAEWQKRRTAKLAAEHERAREGAHRRAVAAGEACYCDACEEQAEEEG